MFHRDPEAKIVLDDLQSFFHYIVDNDFEVYIHRSVYNNIMIPFIHPFSDEMLFVHHARPVFSQHDQLLFSFHLQRFYNLVLSL